MLFLSTLLSLALATGALAFPAVPRGTWSAAAVEARDLDIRTDSAFTPTPIVGCLQSWQANDIVTAFNYLLANPQATNFNATAKALFAKDLTDTSDSINQLAGIPEGSVTFASRDAFIAGSSSQPPLILNTLDVFSSCNKVGWRWISVSGTGNDVTKVKGIDVFEIKENGKIKAIYAEFNSGAWLADLGYPECVAKA